MTRKASRDDPYLFSVTLDDKIPGVRRRQFISTLVGEFFEDVTKRLLRAERYDEPNLGIAHPPDLVCGDHLYEVKARGEGSWLICTGQHEYYQQLEQDGRVLTYVLWEYAGRPRLTKECLTKRQLYHELAKRVKGCWFVPLPLVSALIKPVHSSEFGDARVTVKALKRCVLPVLPPVHISRAIGVVEKTRFYLRPFPLYHISHVINIEGSEVPF